MFKIWGAQKKLEGHCSRMPPCGNGPADDRFFGQLNVHKFTCV